MHARRRPAAWLALVFVVLTGGAWPRTAGGRAAVVVQFADGYQVVRTVAFETATISGMQLLQQSGLAVTDQNGALVCKIGPDGCDYPQTPCFCDPPRFWSYFIWSDPSWSFASTGAATRVISDGAVDGWAWGNGATIDPIEPANLFDEQRLAPGLPTVTAGVAGGLHVQVDVQGDNNDNAAVTAQYRPIGGVWSDELALRRTDEGYELTLTGLDSGTYEVELNFADADGVNGSSAWHGTTMVAALWRVCVPLITTGALH